jgi:hypothetical protein
MRGKSIPLSPMRRFTCDLLRAAASVPTVPVQRRMKLAEVVAARFEHPQRPSWPAIFAKAYAKVSQAFPELRRAYVKVPWPHLYEYPTPVASVAVEREFAGERGVFIGRIKDPAALTLPELDRQIRALRETPILERKDFRRVLALTKVPWPLRGWLWWIGLNIGRQRGNYFGTFALTVYSSLGAESLHPLTPMTTTLNYGVIDANGEVDVRIIYDHRVMDGSTVARALERLEAELKGDILHELRAGVIGSKSAA